MDQLLSLKKTILFTNSIHLSIKYVRNKSILEEGDPKTPTLLNRTIPLTNSA